MKAVVYVLLGAALTWLSAYAMGALLLRKLQMRLGRAEERFFAFIAGSALLSTVVFVFTAVGLARKSIFLAATLPLILFAGWRGLYLPKGDSGPSAPLPWRAVFWAAFAVFSWLYIGTALAPEASPDGVAYHVGLVARYASEQRFPPITTNMYASLSQGVEMLFLYAFSIGRHSATAMVHLLFLFAMPFGILAYGKRIGRVRAGVIAGLLFFASPAVGRTGTIAYVDVAAAAVAFAVFYAVEIWREQRTWQAAALVGLLAGFGYGVKYTLFVGVIYAIGSIAWVLRADAGRALRHSATTAVCALALISPWLIKNALIVQNPFAPFLNRLFPNPYVYASFERDYAAGLRRMNGVTLAEVPVEATVFGGRLTGLVGPTFLLLPFALAAVRRPVGRRVLLAGVVFLIPYYGNIGTRFLLPFLPFASLALALAIDEFRLVAPLVLGAHLVLSWPAVIPLYSAEHAWRLEWPDWQAALRRIPEEAYLARTLDSYGMARRIEAIVPREDNVFGNLGNTAYQSRNVIGTYESSLGNRIYDMLYRAFDPGAHTNLRYRLTGPASSVTCARIVLTSANRYPAAFSEVRFWLAGREVPRTAAWKLRASANPWEVQSAFDNSPVTVWFAGQPTRAGMYVEVDFGSPVQIDEATVDVPNSQSWVALSLHAGTPGNLRTIARSQTGEEIPWPSRMRRAAAEEMKADNLRWIVLRDGDPLAGDLAQRHAQWGVTLVEASRGFLLWRID